MVRGSPPAVSYYFSLNDKLSRPKHPSCPKTNRYVDLSYVWLAVRAVRFFVRRRARRMLPDLRSRAIMTVVRAVRSKLKIAAPAIFPGRAWAVGPTRPRRTRILRYDVTAQASDRYDASRERRRHIIGGRRGVPNGKGRGEGCPASLIIPTEFLMLHRKATVWTP